MSVDKKQKQSKLPLYLSVLLVVSLVLLYFLVPSVKQFLEEAWEVLSSGDKQLISEWVKQFGWWGFLIIILAMTAQMFLLVIPTPLLMVVAVIAYGPFKGSVIVLVGVLIASTVGYFLGAIFGVPVIERLLGKKTEEKIEGFIDDYGFWAVIITRFSPFLSNDAISFVGGILGMNYWRFMGATMAGILPLTVLIAYLGENNDRLISGFIWVSAISLVGFIGYIWWDRRRVNNGKVDA